ncbi:Hca operon transcriptional activator [Aquimixticola soesokkakensis]|uniref:Hca operon transcriptional activator n=2 Tax=Aquimixticola soesokkakensis TaxID=1519096 RepID=A0A1Y5SQW7_9RHOB|nr:Hca operon transcriptional activator [Aquimixticola soesokkakensis]
MAAAQCNLSQPAATQAIAKLETALETPLLLRGAGGLRATQAGALFARRVDTALALLASGARAALRLGAPAKASKRAFDHQITAAQLRALVAVGNSGSFTVAAHDLGLSQPSVHRAARTLEAVAGLALFNATAVGVELTPPAQVLAARVKLAAAELRQGLEEISLARGEENSSIVIGSMPLARTRIVPAAINDMIHASPSTQMRVVEGRYPELLRSLREGDIDCLIGALREPAPADDVTEEVLFDDPIEIVAGPRHPLVGKRNISLEDCLAYPWIAPPRETPAGQYIYNTLKIQELAQTPVRVVSSSLVVLRGLLGLGDYLTLISRQQIAVEEHTGMIVPLDVRLEGNRRAIGLTVRSAWRPTDRQAQFIDLLRKHASHNPSIATWLKLPQ